MKLKVFLNAWNNRRLVGLLYENQEHVYFEYTPDFLKTGIQLSPFKLPLRPGVFEEKSHVFGGLFGLFNDSLPDGWGCLLLDRMLRRRGLAYETISPLHWLALAGTNPMGALEYEPADSEAEVFGKLDLDGLAGQIGQIQEGADSDVLDRLVAMNGSSGGARPKIMAWISEDEPEVLYSRRHAPANAVPWMIKFTEKKDGKNFGETEYRYSLAAKKAGIEMPETRLFPSKLCSGYFGVRRFDRTDHGKVHVHTACGLLHASHRYSSLDYENLLKLTQILTRDQRQVRQMALRMVFNVKMGNRDDHSKNFAFMLDEHDQWKLAPAYDLTPSYGINGEQTAMVNGKGRNISDEDLTAAAETVGVSIREELGVLASLTV